MDLLSQTLASLRTGRPRVVHTTARAPWGLRFAPVAGAGFHLVLDGECWLVPPTGEPVRLGLGDLVFLRSGDGHGMADQPTTPLERFEPRRADRTSPIGRLAIGGGGPRTVLLCGSYQLDQVGPHPLLRGLPEVVRLAADSARYAPLRTAVELLRAEITWAQPGADAIVSALVDALLVYILRAWLAEQTAQTRQQSQQQTRGPGSTCWTTALADAAIGPALRAIHTEPGHPWTVAGLGRQAGLSRAAFARRFTALVGETPLAYLTRWRMTVAGRLLRESELSAQLVSEEVGYQSVPAFSRAFSRSYGRTPGQYRRERAAAAATE